MTPTITHRWKEWSEICARIDARRRNEALRLSERPSLLSRILKFIRVTTGI